MPAAASGSPGVDKAPRRRNGKGKSVAAPRPPRPPVDELAAAARALRAVRPGGAFHLPPGGAPAAAERDEALVNSGPDPVTGPTGAPPPASEVSPAACTPPAESAPSPPDADSVEPPPATSADAAAPADVHHRSAELRPPTEAGEAAAPVAPLVGNAVPMQQPAASFYVDLAKSVVELLTHSRGVAGSLASARTEVNTSADKYEAILRELKTNTAMVTAVRAEHTALAKLVTDLKATMEGSTPEARAQAENDLVRCRTAYASKLMDSFANAKTTSDVWPGPVETTALIHSLVAATLGLSLKDAEELVNGKRETARTSKDAGKRRATPKTTPIVRMFSNRRATFHLQLGDAVVKAWKERVDFSSDPGKTLTEAIRWLNLDKYLMSNDGLAGIIAGVRAMFVYLNCEATYIVEAEEVGEPGHVRAYLGHCSFASTKVCFLCCAPCLVSWVGISILSGWGLSWVRMWTYVF